ncbi:MAG: alpha/beta hydrolase, partial [Candidatus Nanohaloarchaea archaeon]
AETDDDYRLQGLLAEADGGTAVLHIHGMAGNLYGNAFVQKMLSAYPDAGISFLTVEQRGSETVHLVETTRGGFDPIGNAYERFDESRRDIRAWLDFLQDAGYDDIYLQAHSLGPSKVAHFLAEEPHDAIAGVIFISPSEMIGLVEDDSCPEHDGLLGEARELVADGREDELLSGLLWDWAKLSAGTYLDLFGAESDAAVFNYSTPGRGWDAIAAIDVPMLAVLGTADDGIVVGADEAMAMLEEHAENCPRFEGIVVDGAEHDYAGYEDEIIDHVLSFVED